MIYGIYGYLYDVIYGLSREILAVYEMHASSLAQS